LVLVFTSTTVDIAELKEAYVNISLNLSTTKDIYETVIENVTIADADEE